MIDDFYLWTMDIYQIAPTRDASGGFGRSQTLKAAAQPCMIADGATGQTMVGGSLAMINIHPIASSYGGAVNGDVLIITDQNGASVRCAVERSNWRRGRGGIDDFFTYEVREIDN